MKPRKKTLAELYEIEHFPRIAKQTYINLIFMELGFFLSCVIAALAGVWPHVLTFVFWLTCMAIRAGLARMYKPWKIQK